MNVDRTRHLVASEAFAGEVDEFGVGDRLTSSELHRRSDLFAPLLVGDAEHRDIEHGWVFEQGLLDLGRYTLTPPVMIMFVARSARKIHPSSSTWPMSPRVKTPGRR